MGFFDSDRDETGVGSEAFDPGEVPAPARRRLARTHRSGPFTSTLSANGFAVLTSLGPRPVAQVLGASVYQIGWQNLPVEAQWAGEDFTFPLLRISGAWSEARRLALERLEAEAHLVGADGVLGVRLVRGEHDWAKRAVDFVVSGTAIRLPDSGAPDRRPPVLSDLSVQDFWKLRAAGCEPAGIVAATSAMFVSQGTGTRWRRRRSVRSNQELREFSEGFSSARRVAVLDLRDQARALGADGVVGVSFQYDMTAKELAIDRRAAAASGLSVSSIALGANPADFGGGGGDKRDGYVFTFHAVGTAIRRRSGVPERPGAMPQLRRDLNDR